jgi:arsenate reductase
MVKNTSIPTLVGIPNCDSVKSAVKWLKSNKIPFVFRDFREHPLTKSELEGMAKDISIHRLINKKSTTWRRLNLPADLPESTLLETAAANPTLLKRPLLLLNNKWYSGFSVEEWESLGF